MINKLFVQNGDSLATQRLTNAINEIIDYLQSKQTTNVCNCCEKDVSKSNGECICSFEHLKDGMVHAHIQIDCPVHNPFLNPPESKGECEKRIICKDCCERDAICSAHLCMVCLSRKMDNPTEHKEDSKGECNCLCHFNRKPTKEEYAVSSYCGCEHCKSNPPEHEDIPKDEDAGMWSMWEGFDDRAGTLTRNFADKGRPANIQDLQEVFVSKEKIKKQCFIIKNTWIGDFDGPQRDEDWNQARRETVDELLKSLGLGD